MAGVGVPMTVRMASRALRNDGYTLLQITNPFWTIEELIDRGPGAIQAPIVAMVVPALAVAMLMINMRSVASELRRQRVAPPVRVIEEEAQLHPPLEPKPSNPWETDLKEASNP